MAAPVHAPQIDHDLLELLAADRGDQILSERGERAVLLDAALVDQVISQHVGHNSERRSALVEHPAPHEGLQGPTGLAGRKLGRRIEEFTEPAVVEVNRLRHGDQLQHRPQQRSVARIADAASDDAGEPRQDGLPQLLVPADTAERLALGRDHARCHRRDQRVLARDASDQFRPFPIGPVALEHFRHDRLERRARQAIELDGDWFVDSEP